MHLNREIARNDQSSHSKTANENNLWALAIRGLHMSTKEKMDENALIKWTYLQRTSKRIRTHSLPLQLATRSENGEIEDECSHHQSSIKALDGKRGMKILCTMTTNGAE
jgi:hypothetical protein